MMGVSEACGEAIERRLDDAALPWSTTVVVRVTIVAVLSAEEESD